MTRFKKKAGPWLTLPLHFFLRVNFSAPPSPPAQGPQAQQARAQEEHGGGHRGVGDEHAAAASRYGVIQAMQISVGRQVGIVINVNRVGSALVISVNVIPVKVAPMTASAYKAVLGLAVAVKRTNFCPVRFRVPQVKLLAWPWAPLSTPGT